MPCSISEGSCCNQPSTYNKRLMFHLYDRMKFAPSCLSAKQQANNVSTDGRRVARKKKPTNGMEPNLLKINMIGSFFSYECLSLPANFL